MATQARLPQKMPELIAQPAYQHIPFTTMQQIKIVVAGIVTKCGTRWTIGKVFFWKSAATSLDRSFKFILFHYFLFLNVNFDHSRKIVVRIRGVFGFWWGYTWVPTNLSDRHTVAHQRKFLRQGHGTAMPSSETADHICRFKSRITSMVVFGSNSRVDLYLMVIRFAHHNVLILPFHR